MAALIGICYYKGYFSSAMNWINTKNQRAKLLLTLLNNIKTETPAIKDQIVSFTVNDTDVSANIIYERLGQQYMVQLPYDRRYVANMTRFNVELLRKGKLPLNITQQPGIPYLVTAESLGGYAILITDQETGKTHQYSSNIIPMYGEEAMGDE